MNRGSTAAPLLSQQYFDALTGELQQFYLTQSDLQGLEEEFDAKFQRLAGIRDELLEAFGFWAGESADKAAERIASSFERLLPFKFAPDPLPQGGWPTIRKVISNCE
jgi:hypothetical protein